MHKNNRKTQPAPLTAKALNDRLQRIESGINTLLQRTSQIMYSEAQIEKLISDLNTATNTIAAKVAVEEAAIQSLKDQLKTNAGPITQAQLDLIGAGLTGVVDQLTALGADPTNPVPVVDPADNPPVPAVG